MNTQIGASAVGGKGTPQLVPFPPTERSVPKQPPGAPKWTEHKHWLIGAAIALVLLVVGAIIWGSVGSGATVYVTAPATIGPITRGVSATGTVNPELTIIVGTYVSGVIHELTCDYNTQVKRGQKTVRHLHGLSGGGDAPTRHTEGNRPAKLSSRLWQRHQRGNERRARRRPRPLPRECC